MRYRQHYDHKGYRLIDPPGTIAWFGRNLFWTFTIIGCLWLLASALDYEETRNFECASQNLQWDRKSDKCFLLEPGDQQHAKTIKNRKAR